METYTSGKKTGRRGRPAKDCPEVSGEAVRAVRQMLKKKGGKNGYQAAKEKCLILPKARPTLMRKLKLNTERYEATGRIDYNRDLASRVHKDDRDYIESYEKSMYTVWLLEHGVASITDERTRAIAVDTLLKGIPVMKMLNKYQLGRTQVFWEKENAIKFVAMLLEDGQKE